MAAGATHGLTFRLPSRPGDVAKSDHDRAFEVWRASIWTSAAIGMAALVTTALTAVPGPVDEVVMASACTLTGILGHVAPLPD